MDFINRYSRLIEVIEAAVDHNDHDKMYSLIQKEMGMNIRGIASAFYFITGKKLFQYTKERRTVHAAESYLKGSSGTLEAAAERYHYSDSSALGKAIKKLFGKSPSRLSEEDLRRFPAFSIDQILTDQQDQVVTISEKSDFHIKSVIGMAEEEYSKQSEIRKIMEICGFNEKDAEYAYQLSLKHHIDQSKACLFLHDLYLYYRQKEYGMNPLFDI